MDIYGIYDKKDKEQCIFVGTLKEIKNFLGCSIRTFNNYLKYGGNDRYSLVYVYKEGE
jgi:hypothetical protein